MNKSNRTVWLNGELSGGSEAVIPAESKGLLYGAGCFETFRVSNGQFLHFDLHLERLYRGLAYLGVDRQGFPGKENLQKAVLQLIESNGYLNRETMVRIQASVKGRRGYNTEKKEEVDLLITADSLLQRPAVEYSLTTVDIRVVPAECRPSDLKLSNTLHYMQAWREAHKKGADDALMLTVKGFIAETAIANLFWKKDQVIFTPSADCDILPGLMRSIILKLFSRSGDFEIRQGQFRPEDLEDAQLIWLTNSVREVQPVTRVGSTVYPYSDPFYDFLFNAFAAYKKMNLC